VGIGANKYGIGYLPVLAGAKLNSPG